MANTTTPKDENLDSIKSWLWHSTVNNATQSVSGATQQRTQYVSYYALVAAPLHKLTRKDQHFPIRSKWIQESKYDIAYHHTKSMNKDNKKKNISTLK
jgi:hypothetical protein